MNIDQATENIDIVLKNTQMIRAEHTELFANLRLLTSRAQLANELEDKLAGNLELSGKLETEIANLQKLVVLYESKEREPDTKPEDNAEFYSEEEEEKILKEIEEEQKIPNPDNGQLS